MALVITPYDPSWPDRAAALIAQLRAAVGPVRIEHIGSTSIPGMAAKDVIDLQASVPDELDALDFGPLGFTRSPYERDHVPAGLDDDPARWAKRLWTRAGVNLHVRRAGSPNERLALLFRDYLRTHPAAIAPYAAFKRALAGALEEVDAYADVKDPVVDLVIAVAEPWARHTSWTP